MGDVSSRRGAALPWVLFSLVTCHRREVGEILLECNPEVEMYSQELVIFRIGEVLSAKDW